MASERFGTTSSVPPGLPARTIGVVARADEMRARILDAALELLTDGGRDAVSINAVTSAVHIQAPTLYRIFGDKQGLLDSVAEHGFRTHLATWQGWDPDADLDIVEAIRQGWDMHVQWGLQNPYLYSIAYGDARPGKNSPAAAAIDAILVTLVQQAAAAGRLAVPISQATDLLRAVGSGVILTLIAMPEHRRDTSLSDRGREAVLASILTDARASTSRSGAAMQLQATLHDTHELTPHERALLGDWLDRIASRSLG